MRLRHLCTVLALASLLAVPATASAAAPRFHLHPLSPTFNSPIWVGSPPGSKKLFIAERRGVVKRLAHGHVHTWLNIHSRVQDDGGERGLLGMAFSPNYSHDHRFYLYFIDHQGYARVVLYRVRGGRVLTHSRKLVIRIALAPPDAANHNGGNIVASADGTLMIGVGDGGSAGDPEGNAQDTTVLMGKLLRIKPKAGGGYTIPADNPFVGVSGVRHEIFALGLRNPWRWSIDTPTGDIWVGDVGQDSQEEVDVLRGGLPAKANFGWNRLEGTSVFDAATTLTSGTTQVDPVYTYTHSDGCAIVGGHVYRGSVLPRLRGRFLFADNCGSWIRGTTGTSTWRRSVAVGGISTFGQGPGKELYVASLNTGHVYRIGR